VIISSGLTRSLLTIAHRLLRHATANSRMLMRVCFIVFSYATE
jgi:hypothetical protein